MSLVCHASKLLHTVTKIQQSAQISTSSNLLSSCGRKKCPVIKVAGCSPRIRFDCEPVQKRRCKCVRIDVPEPCFSECFRCPPPPTRRTECPDCSIKGLKPPKHCLKKKLGITIDGCDPRDSIKMLGSCRPRNVACKKVNKPCEYVNPNIPVCDPCFQPFRSYEPCVPPPRQVKKQACYAPKQDCEQDQPTCSSCQVKPSCNTKKTLRPEHNCIDPDANCIDPQPPCGGPDPACQMEEPCRTDETPICCSQAVCDFRTAPRKRDAALKTCRSCTDENSELFSTPPTCPTCGNPAPPSCPMCGGPMDDCEKKPSMVDTLWNLFQGKR